jgi:hypothetical protein
MKMTGMFNIPTPNIFYVPEVWKTYLNKDYSLP